MKNHNKTLFKRIFCTIIFVALTTAFTITNAREERGKHTLTVMTQNMDVGTDFIFLFAVPGTFPDLKTAATFTYGEVLKSNIPKRAALLAKMIARQQPDLISLQEVTLWETISSGQKAILFDQLALLQKELAKLNQHYQVVVRQNLSQSQLAVDTKIIGRFDDNITEISFTDRDVILARTDRKRFGWSLSHARAQIYSTLLELPPPLPLGKSVRGWMSVDIKLHGKSARFVNTHLETVIPDPRLVDFTKAIQVAQAQELIQVMDTIHLPIIFAGDFNADAEFAGIGPDQTETPNKILDAGYTDAWDKIFPSKPGFTWPLFFEDPLRPNPNGPFERIDIIYARDLDIRDVKQVGLRSQHLFPSDHAGVVAKLQFDKHRTD